MTSKSAITNAGFNDASITGRRLSGSSCLLFTLAILLLVALPLDAKGQLRTEDFTFRVGGKLSFPSAPSELADHYSNGRGIEGGLKVFINPSLRFVSAVEYEKFNAQLGPNFTSGPVRPDLNFDPVALPGDIAGGDMTVTSLRAGIEYHFFTLSEITTPYIKAAPRLVKLRRAEYITEGHIIDDPEMQAILGPKTESAFGLDFTVGLQLGVSYTTAIYIEPHYSITYGGFNQYHSIGIRSGLLFGEF